MVRKVVRLLKEVTTIDLAGSSLEEPLSVVESVFDHGISEERPESVLIFGLGGAGKTMLATATGHWLMHRLPGYQALFIDCPTARILPDVAKKQARKLVEPWLEGLDLLRKEPAEGSIFVFDGIESVSAELQSTTINLIRLAFIEMMDQPSKPVYVIATATDPERIDRALLGRLPKRLYVPPAKTDNVRDWLLVGGIAPASADQVSNEIGRLMEVSRPSSEEKVEFMAPGNLIAGMQSRAAVGLDPEKEDPTRLARDLCVSAAELFIDSESKTLYEDEHEFFIRQSKRLVALFENGGIHN